MMTVSETLYFDQNMALLKEYYPHIHDTIIENLEPVSGVDVIRAENNKLNLEVRISETESVLIHDANDPGSEIQSFLSMVPENSTGVVLMFGMGLGYSVIELLKKRKNIQYLVLFELNPEFFIQALRCMDLSEVLSDNRLILCIETPENLGPLMAPVHKALMLENIHTLSLITCYRVNREYEALSTVVTNYISVFNADGNTKLAYGRTFIENRLKHLTSMHHNRKLEELSGRFKDIPAIIVAAGPSLDKNIDQLQDAVGKAIIISVDSALPALLAKGICPDFVTSIDYQELAWEKIADVSSNPCCRDINLICTTWVTDLVPKQFPAKQVFWAYSRSLLEDWINEMMGGHVGIGGAATVAHLNFVSANLMGCAPIVFVGQDLAFSEEKGHSSHVVISSDQRVIQQLKSGQDIIWIKGGFTPKVPSNRQMNGYRHTFEKLIQEAGNQVINATEGGAFIQGAEHLPLSEAIDVYCKKDRDVAIEVSEKPSKLHSSLESALVEINKAVRVVKKADKLSGPVQKKLSLLDKNKGEITSFSRLPEPLQKKLSDLDLCHKKADNMPLFSLFDEITMEGLRLNEREKKSIEAIEGQPEKYFEWLSRSLVRIGKINDIRMENLFWFKDEINGILDYHKEEIKFRNQIEQSVSGEEAILRLAHLYYSFGNYVQLEKLLIKQEGKISHTPEYSFYYGVINLIRGARDAAEKAFESTVKKDSAYIRQISEKRSEIADFYFGQALSRKTKPLSQYVRHPLVESLAFKAAQMDPVNEKVKNEIKQLAAQDYKAAVRLTEAKNENKVQIAEQLIQKWVRYIDSYPDVCNSFEKHFVSGLYLQYGKLLIQKNNFQGALKSYELACAADSDNPEIHISLSDLYFQTHDYDTGLVHLKTAVAIDKKYAVYWHNMAENFKSLGDFESAILAYEQYFVALPENIMILKEIGDCHKQLGNLEAAYESYAMLKKKLKAQ